MRAICGQAGLGVRYFYESFTDKDDFVGAVFDSVIADIAATTQAAVASAPPDEQARAGMANVVRAISADHARGPPAVQCRVVQHGDRAQTRGVDRPVRRAALPARRGVGALENDHVKAASHFAVGGVTQTISAWLSGEVSLDHDELVDVLAALIDQLAALPPQT